MNKVLYVIFAFMFALPSVAQITGANEVLKGNKDYKMESWDKAEEHYRKSLEKGEGSTEGKFNLANSLYRQKKFKESAAIFKSIAETGEQKDIRSQAYHNLGNALINDKNLEGGIEAYKNALRLNPADEETRHNLAIALKEKQKQEQQNKDKDQNQDQKDQEKNKDQQKNQDQQKKEQEKKDQEQQQKQNEQKQDQQEQEKQQPKPQPDQLSKEEAQRILDALNRDEKDIQDKLKKKKMKVQQKNVEKDW